MENLIVRDGHQEDLDEILRLWVQMVDFHADLDPRLRMRTDAEGLDHMRAYLHTRLDSPDSRLFVAEVAGVDMLVGFLLAHVRAVSPIALPPTCGYISDISVNEHFRRLGVGRQLFLAAREWFRERGQSLIRLNVAAANPVSQLFWRAMGADEKMLVMEMDL